ncbi:hypothetical protein J41TS12_10510 [Paenibacillus antibioticophila]|uniref:Uncharacterized protein n=1 Tax=Paenibacillus antibioticophila TaxID=1274374 RepID=A0A920CE30_9BACL|nr:hypothetical protein [Paenibacillus antibioticophila]GIO36190.1 hypothetical protein J41TS12_10510 [Paenibacillus antibioticophila]
MDKIDMAALIGLVSALSGLILGWAGRGTTVRKEIKEDATIDATMRADIGYIRHSVDDVRMTQGQQSQKFDALTEKVIRVEESAKQAHKRIDRLEGNEGRG